MTNAVPDEWNLSLLLMINPSSILLTIYIAWIYVIECIASSNEGNIFHMVRNWMNPRFALQIVLGLWWVLNTKEDVGIIFGMGERIKLSMSDESYWKVCFLLFQIRPPTIPPVARNQMIAIDFPYYIYSHHGNIIIILLSAASSAFLTYVHDALLPCIPTCWWWFSFLDPWEERWISPSSSLWMTFVWQTLLCIILHCHERWLVWSEWVRISNPNNQPPTDRHTSRRISGRSEGASASSSASGATTTTLNGLQWRASGVDWQRGIIVIDIPSDMVRLDCVKWGDELDQSGLGMNEWRKNSIARNIF